MTIYPKCLTLFYCLENIDICFCKCTSSCFVKWIPYFKLIKSSNIFQSVPFPTAFPSWEMKLQVHSRGESGLAICARNTEFNHWFPSKFLPEFPSLLLSLVLQVKLSWQAGTNMRPPGQRVSGFSYSEISTELLHCPWIRKRDVNALSLICYSFRCYIKYVKYNLSFVTLNSYLNI